MNLFLTKSLFRLNSKLALAMYAYGAEWYILLTHVCYMYVAPMVGELLTIVLLSYRYLPYRNRIGEPMGHLPGTYLATSQLPTSHRLTAT